MRKKLQYQNKYGIKRTLRGYQREAAQVGVVNPNYALLMAPRLGKTRIDIAVAGYRFKNDGVKRWVVVCPSIAKHVWAAEIQDVLDVPCHLRVLEGPADERKLMVKGWKDEPGKLSILIMNHEATWRIRRILYKFSPDKVTVDESHKIKNRAAKQSKTIWVLGRRARFRCIMTGTFLSTPTDAFAQFRFLDDTIFGDNWKDFLREYVATYGYGGLKPKTFKNLDRLNEKVQSVAYQLGREEAGGFPQEQYQDIKFQLTSPAKRHYAEMEKELKTCVRGEDVTADIILTQILRLQQITGGFLPTPDPEDIYLKVNTPIGKDRLRALEGLLDEYPEREPLVIFARFRYELEAISQALTKRGRSFSRIMGGIPERERTSAKLLFQAGGVDTCLVQIRAGGIAIDLSRANTGIFYSLTTSFIDYEQARARIISRKGGSVSLIHLVAEGTVDEDVLASVKGKQDLAKMILKKLG